MYINKSTNIIKQLLKIVEVTSLLLTSGGRLEGRGCVVELFLGDVGGWLSVWSKKSNKPSIMDIGQRSKQKSNTVSYNQSVGSH